MTKDAAALLPCPFCGGNALLTKSIPDGYGPEWHVICAGNNPDCPTPEVHEATREAVTKVWNMRPTPEPPVQRPVAWMRRAVSPGGPWGPAEVDYECYAGDVPPADGNNDWIPLYRHAEPASREAPSPCPSVHDHMWAEDGHCMRCYAVKSGAGE